MNYVSEQQIIECMRDVDKLKKIVAEHQRIIDSQWTALQQAGMRTTVFGPGDDDYGRGSAERHAFKCLGEPWRK